MDDCYDYRDDRKETRMKTSYKVNHLQAKVGSQGESIHHREEADAEGATKTGRTSATAPNSCRLAGAP